VRESERQLKMDGGTRTPALMDYLERELKSGERIAATITSLS